LKSDKDRIEESEKLVALMATVPGRTVKKEMAKLIAGKLLGGSASVDLMTKIMKEIEEAHYTTSDPEIIIPARDAGLCGEQVASVALGFDDDEYKQAKKDHLDRILRIAEAQSKGSGAGAPAKDGENGQPDPKDENAGSRGLKDLSGDPAAEAKGEKETSRDTTLEDETKSKTRGKGRKTNEE